MMEYFDLLDEHGQKTGKIVSREEAHRKGLWHETVHIWVIRERDHFVEILLQKRAQDKDSYPGCYDISAAGHISAGQELISAALRECHEELGLKLKAEDLTVIGCYQINYDAVFHTRLFKDREFAHVFVTTTTCETFHLQEEEVEAVRWLSYEACEAMIGRDECCVNPEDWSLLKCYLQKNYMHS